MLERLTTPLLWVLRRLYELTHNWALSIALLVLVIKTCRLAVIWSWPGRISQWRLEKGFIKLKREVWDHRSPEYERRQIELLKEHGPAMQGSVYLTLTQRLASASVVYGYLGFLYILTHAPDLRGAPLLWTPDMTSRDPTYIIPMLILGYWIFGMSRVVSKEKKDWRPYFFAGCAWAGLHAFLPAGLGFYHLCSVLTQPTMTILAMLTLGTYFKLVRRPAPPRKPSPYN